MRSSLLREKAFFQQAKQVVEEQRNRNWCVIAIDLDHFSLFNEWYGRKTGDQLLGLIAKELLVAEESSGGLAGYLGQDDFCLLAPYEESRVKNLHDRLTAHIAELATALGFKPIFGVCLIDEDIPFMDLFDRAKLAMEHARNNFKADICMYDPQMQEQTAKEYRTLIEFQKGLQEDEFIVYLQPQCRISSRKIVGAEALARWRKADGTIVPPDEFVPILEKHGFITDLDCLIWEQVCINLRNWLDTGHKAVPVSVNVSQADIYSIDVAEHFNQLVEKYRIPRNLLKVEITESAFAESAAQVVEVTKKLRDAGFTVLMDDFGSGYSSLNMLSNLSVDVIKLDAEFMRIDEASKRKGIRIVESIINMAKTMALPIITEGVETKEQVDFLDSLGVRYIQGFYFYHPMCTEEFETLIEDGTEIDDRGFTVKQNEQFRIREFLDENVYSDAMLNSILGPVAFYAWRDDNVDIVRFNEQFYEAVGSPNFSESMVAIQRFTPQPDRPKLFSLFQRAAADELNGASETIGFFKTDGTLMRFHIHAYYLGEGDGGKIFYGSARDVTDAAELKDELQLLSECLSHSVVFMRHFEGVWRYKVIIHGLANVLGISQDQLQKSLNGGTFFNRLEPGVRNTIGEALGNAANADRDFCTKLSIITDKGENIDLQMEADHVQDSIGDASFIVTLDEFRDR